MDLDLDTLDTGFNIDDIELDDLSNIDVDIDFSNIDIDPKEMLEEAIGTLNEIDLEREDY